MMNGRFSAMRSACMQRHCDPPENQAQDAEEWWLSMVKDTSEKAAKWNNHPLMMLLFRAVTEYVEQKAAEKTQRTMRK